MLVCWAPELQWPELQAIDGVDNPTLPADLVRPKITTIPQEPYFPANNTTCGSLDGGRRRQTDTELVESFDTIGLLLQVLSHRAPALGSGDGDEKST
jgi:hypothetical protein